MSGARVTVTAGPGTPEPASVRTVHDRALHRINGATPVSHSTPFGVYLVKHGRRPVVGTDSDGRRLYGDPDEIIGTLYDEARTRRGAITKANRLAAECARTSTGTRGSAVAVVVATDTDTIWHRAEVVR